MVTHYADRATVGPVIGETAQIQRGYSAFGYEGDVYGAERSAGLRRVTDAVHASGGLVFCQLQHYGGRAAVPCSLDPGMHVVAPSLEGIRKHECAGGFARDGEKQRREAHPHALTEAEIAELVPLFATAARNSIEAGFGGVEVHGANAYIINQSMCDMSEQRTDVLRRQRSELRTLLAQRA